MPRSTINGRTLRRRSSGVGVMTVLESLQKWRNEGRGLTLRTGLPLKSQTEWQQRSSNDLSENISKSLGKKVVLKNDRSHSRRPANLD
jgi:hypothetical protein